MKVKHTIHITIAAELDEGDLIAPVAAQALRDMGAHLEAETNDMMPESGVRETPIGATVRWLRNEELIQEAGDGDHTEA